MSENQAINVRWYSVLGMVGMLAAELTKAAVDGKITVREMINIGEKVCGHLDIELDKEGFDI